jgi:hypothetical protein
VLAASIEDIDHSFEPVRTAEPSLIKAREVIHRSSRAFFVLAASIEDIDHSFEPVRTAEPSLIEA